MVQPRIEAPQRPRHAKPRATRQELVGAVVARDRFQPPAGGALVPREARTTFRSGGDSTCKFTHVFSGAAASQRCRSGSRRFCKRLRARVVTRRAWDYHGAGRAPAKRPHPLRRRPRRGLADLSRDVVQRRHVWTIAVDAAAAPRGEAQRGRGRDDVEQSRSHQSALCGDSGECCGAAAVNARRAAPTSRSAPPETSRRVARDQCARSMRVLANALAADRDRCARWPRACTCGQREHYTVVKRDQQRLRRVAICRVGPASHGRRACGLLRLGRSIFMDRSDLVLISGTSPKTHSIA